MWGHGHGKAPGGVSEAFDPGHAGRILRRRLFWRQPGTLPGRESGRIYPEEWTEERIPESQWNNWQDYGGSPVHAVYGRRKTEDYVTEYLEFNLVVDSSNETRVKVAELIEEQLEDIGINVYLYRVSNSGYKSYLEDKDYDMIITGVNNGYSPDLSYFFGKDNIANYKNEEIQGILNDIKNISDKNLLTEKYNRIIEIYEDEMPYICLYRNREKIVYSIRLTGEIAPNNYTAYSNFENWYRQ